MSSVELLSIDSITMRRINHRCMTLQINVNLSLSIRNVHVKSAYKVLIFPITSLFSYRNANTATPHEHLSLLFVYIVLEV